MSPAFASDKNSSRPSVLRRSSPRLRLLRCPHAKDGLIGSPVVTCRMPSART